MNALKIPASEFTPIVDFNPENHLFVLDGVSRPENVLRFYAEIFEWLKEYEVLVLDNMKHREKPGLIQVEFRLKYFNSASAKSLLQMLELIKSFKKYHMAVTVEFYYDEGDEQMRDDGEELSEAIEMPFNYHEI